MDDEDSLSNSYSYNVNGSNFTNDWDLWCMQIDRRYLGSAVFVSVMSFLGAIANISLLIITYLNKSLRTPSNIFLINVIAGDLIYILIRAPVHANKLLRTMCWHSSEITCQLHQYFETVAQYICILSLTALSIERYMAVVRGLESRQTNSRNVKIFGVLATWNVALLMAIPTGALSYRSEDMPICTSVCFGNIGCLMHDLYRFFTLYFLPLLVISILYVSIAVTLYKSSHTMLNNTRQDASNRRQTSQRRRLAVIFILITVSFGVLWMPHYVDRLRKQVRFLQGDSLPHNKVLSEVSAISALLNACLDPFIVFAMSTVYRKNLSKCFHRHSRYFCGKSENLNMNNHNRGNNYHRPSVTLFTSLRAPQSTVVAMRRNSPSTVNSDTAL